VLFKDKANGSLVVQNDRIVGSRLLGQQFTRPEYFHPRPSAAGTDGYDATASSGSNLGPTNQKLYQRVKASAEQFRKENPDYLGPIPADALTASGSGLDPDISIANADAQGARIAKTRGATRERIGTLILAARENRALGFLGEPRVNILELNRTLDAELPTHP
jgi:K+-transporting ATPase ATPase C chain